MLPPSVRFLRRASLEVSLTSSRMVRELAGSCEPVTVRVGYSAMSALRSLQIPLIQDFCPTADQHRGTLACRAHSQSERLLSSMNEIDAPTTSQWVTLDGWDWRPPLPDAHLRNLLRSNSSGRVVRLVCKIACDHRTCKRRSQHSVYNEIAQRSLSVVATQSTVFKIWVRAVHGPPALTAAALLLFKMCFPLSLQKGRRVDKTTMILVIQKQLRILENLGLNLNLNLGSYLNQLNLTGW
jgi:hypothetical protein